MRDLTIRSSDPLAKVLPADAKPCATIWGIPVYEHPHLTGESAVLCYRDQDGIWRNLPITRAELVIKRD